jgi:hypothetical protein
VGSIPEHAAAMTPLWRRTLRAAMSLGRGDLFDRATVGSGAGLLTQRINRAGAMGGFPARAAGVTTAATSPTAATSRWAAAPNSAPRFQSALRTVTVDRRVPSRFFTSAPSHGSVFDSLKGMVGMAPKVPEVPKVPKIPEKGMVDSLKGMVGMAPKVPDIYNLPEGLVMVSPESL